MSEGQPAPRRLRMRELTAASGLPASTIHLYVRMGLLPEPERTGRNQALYDESFLERLRLIRELHTEGNMSLAAIRETLARLPLGGAAVGSEHVAEVLHAIADELRDAPGEARNGSYAGLSAATVEADDLVILVELGLIDSAAAPESLSTADLRIATAFAALRLSAGDIDIRHVGGMLAIIAESQRLMSVLARMEAQEIASAIAELGDLDVPTPDFVTFVLQMRDELVAAIHRKELARACEELLRPKGARAEAEHDM